jgi:Fe-S cluster assembly ATP-binding protein
MLEVKNLHVEIDGKKILNGLDLTIEKGKVHAIMGPNGSGKSTLAYVLAGKTDYQVTAGEVLFDGEDLLAMQPDERAARGVFLAFQYPMEIPGVAVRAGTHCVMPLLARYGVTATCRASFALYKHEG